MSMAELLRRAQANAKGATADSPPVKPTSPAIPPSNGIILTRVCRESDLPSVCQCTHKSYQDIILIGVYDRLAKML